MMDLYDEWVYEHMMQNPKKSPYRFQEEPEEEQELEESEDIEETP